MRTSNDHPVHDRLSSIEFFVGQHSLFFAAGGEAIFYVHQFKPLLPVWIAFPFFLLPWIFVFMTFYAQQPLFPARQSRHFWLYAVFAYAAFTVIAESIWLLGDMPALMPHPPVTPFGALILIQVLLNIGWLSFVPLVRDYFRNPQLWS